jgi:molybdate transport system substrate-binding protein
MLRFPLRCAAYLLAAGAVVCGCGGDDGGEGSADGPSGAITVFAAASLSASFTALGEAFEAENAGTSVTFNFAASSELVTQINEGAPADVYASADQANMQRLIDGIGTVGDPQVFASNVLQIIVEPGNPLAIAGVDDLADPDVLFVTAAPEVPIGRYTREVLDAAGVEVAPKSLEESVRGVVGKVVLGEADAGIVYVTDVIAAGDGAEGVEIPLDVNVVATYPMALPADASNTVTAQAFVDFVVSDAGRAVLAAYGFAAP